MPIIYHEGSQEFHLYNHSLSYILNILPNGHIGHLYCGKRLRDRGSFAYLQEGHTLPNSCFPMKELPDFSLEFTPREYPDFGHSDFRRPAFELLQENGSHISELVYISHNIAAGKPDLPGLPHAYTEKDSEAVTLSLLLRDELTGCELTLFYTIFEELPVIARSARFENCGGEVLRLNRAMSLSMDFPDNRLEWVQFSGTWAREREPKCRPLEQGITAVESMRGQSGHHQNPFVLLKRPETDEEKGEAFGFSLLYSGNFLAQAETDTYSTVRFSMGINPREFCWKLEPGESFVTPEALMTFSDTGLNGLSQALHTLLRTRVARGPWRDRPRPILLNNWEATGMEFTEEDILRIAQKGAEVGVELFVLDDGWFGRRTEFSGLGDWFTDRSKLPHGLVSLSKMINALGLDFGIWIEPEMISEDSELYRTHPEFVLRTPGRRTSLGRNQLVLDFSNPEVVDYIYNMLLKAFEGVSLSYIKWDMNRAITECYSAHWPADRQGEIYHRYILGVYSLYEKMLKAFPDLLFESCASGGGRLDPGMLYYAPQAWCSDDTDAGERVRIQYGTSYGYPVSSWGAHVSVCPNQQLGRTTPLYTRANVAFFGAFGYEMDLNALSDEEIALVKEQIRFMKAHRTLIQYGTFYRLRSPFENRLSAWMVVSPDGQEALVGLYLSENRVSTGFVQVPLQGLDPRRDYRINGGTVRGGDDLMYYGLRPADTAGNILPGTGVKGLPDELSCDFDSRLYYLTAEE